MRLIGFLFTAAMAAGAAVAQVRPPVAASPSAAPVRSQLFVAPSGAPYRAVEGEAYPIAAWVAAVDTNHDGRISQSEFSADFARFFDQLDTDHDGVLRADEVQHYEQVVLPEVRSIGEGYGGGGGRRSGFSSDGDFGSMNRQIDEKETNDVGHSPEIDGDLHTGPMGAGRFALINIPEPIASMDVDFNGLVSRNEMLSAARRRFALLDPDGKGVLMAADLPQTWAQAHPRRARRR